MEKETQKALEEVKEAMLKYNTAEEVISWAEQKYKEATNYHEVQIFGSFCSRIH
jgi:hypothetical protein